VMQAIFTKSLGPTNNRGARVVAECDAKRIVVSWEYSLNVEQNHERAAMLLIGQLGWTDSIKEGMPFSRALECFHAHWATGSLKREGYAHVMKD
jgi:hypothetical protein